MPAERRTPARAGGVNQVLMDAGHALGITAGNLFHANQLRRLRRVDGALQLGQRLGWMLLPVSSPSRVLDRFVAIPSEFRLVTFGAIVGLIANTFHVSR